MKETKPMSRRARKAWGAGILTILVVAAVILVNVISLVLTDKFSVFTADMTNLQAFALTEQSEKIAENIGKNVTISFLSEKRDYENRDPYCKQTSVIANELAKASGGMIRVEYTDIVTNPTFANDYQGEELTANDVIVRCGDQKRILKVSDLFTFEVYSGEYQYITSSQAEQVIDQALVTVTSDVVTKTAVITDNSTKEYDYFVKTLNANNYQTVEVSLEEEDIPTEVQTVLIYEPQKDFSEAALKKLEAFLLNGDNYGKSLLYVPDKGGADHPILDSFIALFGITVADGIAFEYDSSCRYYESDYYEYILCSFASEQYRQNFDENKYTPVMTGVSRPLVVDSKSAFPLLMLSEQSGIYPYSADEEWVMKDAVTGDVCVMAQTVLGEEDKKSFVTVIGSGDMLSQVYFSKTTGNQTYIMTMMAECSGRDASMIVVPDKVLSQVDIELDAQARFWLGFALYAVLPLMILGCGLTVFLVRRSL